ncbi:MAG: hypothetical protein ACKVY0_12495 [Prosthecobacter sp.]|uniref:hypothetical protein n=1 Tax=Prosthecobacter sp. TaxID=1965333 RepID=UPI003901D3B6
MSALVIEPLPKSLLIRLARSAAKHQRTVSQEALVLLMECVPEETGPETEQPYFARRNLMPEFETMQQAGAFRLKAGDRDITDLISEDRDGR